MATTHETIDHTTLTKLVEANLVSGANIIGMPGGWGVVVQYGMIERALAAQRGAVRIFRKFETLVVYLKEIGVVKYQVDASGFDPVALKLSRSNAGAGARMKATHDAAAYGKWFHAQVDQAQIEADDPNTKWVTNEEANASWAEKRAQLVKLAEEHTA